MADDVPSTAERYEITYHAKRDALWDVIGTIVYTIFLFIGFYVGLLVLGMGMTTSQFTLMTAVFVLLGLALVIGSVIRFIQLFDLVPDWF